MSRRLGIILASWRLRAMRTSRAIARDECCRASNRRPKSLTRAWGSPIPTATTQEPRVTAPQHPALQARANA
eukprot:3601138-Lingulodinium_polyedra.AAC.1